jgi:hypothetical protein
MIIVGPCNRRKICIPKGEKISNLGQTTEKTGVKTADNGQQ